MKICTVGAKFFHGDIRRDMTTLIVAFSISTNASKNAADKRCIENQNTHFMCNIFFLNRAFVRQCGKILYSRAGLG